MKRFLPLFIILIALFSTNQVQADDILFPFGQNISSPTPPSWKYRGGGANLNAVAWKTYAYTETNWQTGGSALGFGGGPSRNTSIPENTSFGGGGAAGARYSTMYFRKKLDIASFASYYSYQMRVQFDDAIIVWVNGTLAYNNNIASTAQYADWATTSIANNGSDIYTVSLPASLFTATNNIIAVEIHQNSATSTDLFFDMELKGITSPPDDVLMDYGAAAWKYRGGGVNLDAVAWKALAYGEPSWVTGTAALGYGAGPAKTTTIPENNTAGGGGAVGAHYSTMYFRKVLNVATPSAYAGFKFNMKFDDGIVVYLNGTEIYRNNMPEPSSYASWASSAIANNGADEYSVVVGKTKFNPGNNIIAVEVHQTAATSSDLYFDMQVLGLNSTTTNILRGPYLQLGSKTGISIRWRTDLPTTSKVTWGTTFGTYPNEVSDATDTTEHEILLSGLTADTKYYYTIGSTTNILEATTSNYFQTLPPDNATRKMQILAFGDCGNNSTNQRNVRDAFKLYATAKSINPDAWILLGDNGYSAGTDNEYTSGFFNIYSGDLLKNIKLYPAPGNHDYGHDPAQKPFRNTPYYKTFSMPKNAEAGGVPSGTEAYYSFNVGDIHFVSLDSYGTESGMQLWDTLAGSAQADWLKADLTANTKRWTVAYFHHPPYTLTSHTSDTESDLIAIRETLNKLLERFGVDMVICGHAHGYERSFLLKGYYNNAASPLLDANFNAATHTATGNTQNGKYNGLANSCAYKYNSGKSAHGTMYMVAGSAGQIGGSQPNYPLGCMAYSNNTDGGSFYFEVDSNRLDAKFISYTGTGATVAPAILDSFTIFKDVQKTNNLVVTQNNPTVLSASWKGTYVWPTNGGVTTRSVTVNNPTIGTFQYRVRDAFTCIEDVFNLTVTATVPVNLTAFNAVLSNDQVMLDWTTSQESNNKYFSIERSTDGINYTLLGNVNGAVTSAIPTNYHMVDPAPAEGLNYYRLSQTDMDGVKRNLEVKRVTYRSAENFKVTVINGSQGMINVTVKNTNGGMVNMRVIDMAGREILKRAFNTSSASVTQSFHLLKGVYVLVLTNNTGEIIKTKIISD